MAISCSYELTDIVEVKAKMTIETKLQDWIALRNELAGSKHPLVVSFRNQINSMVKAARGKYNVSGSALEKG